MTFRRLAPYLSVLVCIQAMAGGNHPWQALARESRKVGIDQTSRSMYSAARGPLTQPQEELWRSKPTVVGEQLFSDDHHIWALQPQEDRTLIACLDRQAGTLLWEAALPGDTGAAPILAGNCIAFASSTQGLVLLDAKTGRETRRIPLGPGMPGSPEAPLVAPLVESAGCVVLAGIQESKSAPEGKIAAFDLSSGQLRWEFKAPNQTTLTVEHFGDSLYVGLQGSMVALEASNGKERWHFIAGGQEYVDVSYSFGDKLCYISGGELIALNASTGKLLWRRPCGGNPLIAGEGDRMLFVERRGLFADLTLLALDTNNGQEVWRVKVRNTRLPWVKNGRVLLNAEQELRMVNLSDGKRIWSYSLAGRPMFPLTPTGDVLYEIDPRLFGYVLRAISMQDGKLLWKRSIKGNVGEGWILPDPEGLIYPAEDGSLIRLR